MEGVASEVSLKIRSAIKAKLVELGTYVDEELPDYIMVLVANKKTKDQMDDDLSLFLGHNTERFTSWLHHVLQKLNAAALLQGTTAPPDPGKNKATAAQEEAKRKELEEEKRREKEEEKKKEREEEKKRQKQEEARKPREEEKRKSKEKDKTERKRKSSERKGDKKEKKLKKSESPTSPEKTSKEKRVSDAVKPVKIKETLKEKEKPKPPPPSKEETFSTEKTQPTAEPPVVKSSLEVTPKKMKPLVRGKISSADIFRAESQAEQKKEEEEEELEEDLLVLRADDDLGLELEDELAPKKSKQDPIQRTVQLRTEAKEERKAEPKVTAKTEAKEKADHKDRTVSRDKTEHRDKGKGKGDPPAPRISAKERLGGIVAPKSNTSREKPSVLDRLGSSTSGKHIINLREESSVPSRSESTSGTHSQAVARVVSSAITSAHRSVCVLPPSNSSGKKLEARVRPLMSRQVESSHVSVSRGISGEETSSRGEERVRESVSRPSSGRVVSAVGAVLKRPHAQSESDDEEYDPKKPGLSGVASKVEVTPRPRRPRAIQANTALILRAMADAHKSVNRPSRRSREKEKEEKHKSRKKHKGELFSRSYRQREEASKHKGRAESPAEIQETVSIRKIAITVPNATHKESENLRKQKKEEEAMEEDEEEEVEVDVSIAMRPHVPVAVPLPETPMEVPKKESKLDPMETQEEAKTRTPDTDYGMEEVEEVEEEVVDEGIEEDQPPVRHPLPPVIGSGENTKFIVTLEGMDTEEFPEKEEHLSIRSRLGVRPPPADTEDQVEEYIEEVEEWEEEEEVPEELTVTSGVPASGLVTGVKARLKAAAAPVTSLPPGSTKERCKYWPLCKAGEGCIYHHPTVTCKSFPACKFGDKCLFIHPNCLYDGACTRLGCPYTHASSRNFAMVSATAAQKHKVVAPTRTSTVKCKFFPKCTNLSCPFLHPKACYYGAACKQQPNCPFTHPAVPMGAKLKWVAPKPSAPPSAASTTTTTTTTAIITSPVADSKEGGKKEESLIVK